MDKSTQTMVMRRTLAAMYRWENENGTDDLNTYEDASGVARDLMHDVIEAAPGLDHDDLDGDLLLEMSDDVASAYYAGDTTVAS